MEEYVPLLLMVLNARAELTLPVTDVKMVSFPILLWKMTSQWFYYIKITFKIPTRQVIASTADFVTLLLIVLNVRVEQTLPATDVKMLSLLILLRNNDTLIILKINIT